MRLGSLGFAVTLVLLALLAANATTSGTVTIVTWLLASTMLVWSLLMRRRENVQWRNIERDLRQTNVFLDSIVENIPDMIFVKEAKELRFERVNRAGEQLIGLARAELVGKNDYDFFPPDEARFFQDKDRQALASTEVVDIAEEPLETRNGRRWLHTKKVPIHDASGTPLYLLGISEDITERKLAAEALQRAQAAADSANLELEAFTYSIAHDLRTPLRGIDGFSLALLEEDGDKLSSDGKAHLERVRGAAQRMGQLIDDMLSLARVSRAEMSRTGVDLSRMAEQIAAQLERAQLEHDKGARSVRWDIQPGLTVSADASLVRVLLENLLGNAWKFTGKREQAEIAFGMRDGQYYVRDNGAGFDMTYVGNLFGVFCRLHSVVDFPGTGIGLAIARRIVERHGGRISASGVIDGGAEIRFTLAGGSE